MTQNTTEDQAKQKVTCYSEGEQKMMDQSQKIRGLIFRGFLSVLDRCKITPNHLTLLSLLCGVGFCFCFQYCKTGAIILLVLHVLLDGLDGPLARQTGKASNKGSFTDTTSDQIVVALSTLTLMYFWLYPYHTRRALYFFLYRRGYIRHDSQQPFDSIFLGG